MEGPRGRPVEGATATLIGASCRKTHRLRGAPLIRFQPFFKKGKDIIDIVIE